ncbi:MAG: YggS family pyridoxal phosphate-dependent enzyme [Flavobacteriaceae bacterium]|nr:YggS family pyridoxal phosphate-dependent enzyme [Flavobacteriaceae bacterium]
MSISKNLIALKASLPKEVTLVAVSKTKPVAAILEAYNAEQRIFGENKVQEMVCKYEELPKDIKWHMIGHLQRNKIKHMAHFVDLIHGVDHYKTLIEINKQAKKHHRIIRCLLQVKIAAEETKFGLDVSSIESILQTKALEELTNIKIVGFMAMASFTNNKAQIATEFSKLKTFFNYIKNTKKKNVVLKTLSIGMSSDYKIAIENDSTMIRVGAAIFGNRN